MEAVGVAVFLLVVFLIGIPLIGYFLYSQNVQSYNLVQFERIAVFKDTGEFLDIRGPGLVRIRRKFLFLSTGEQVRDQYGNVVADTSLPSSRFDLRENPIQMADEHCITRDSAVVNITPSIVYQITDPEKLVLNIGNHLTALGLAAKSTLRAVVGTMSLTDVITARESIAQEMRAQLAEQADRWGINVISLEIQDIKPEMSVERAMNERRAAEEQAERDRFQYVVSAEAKLQGAAADNKATISNAEAEKQATITKAEGEREAEILRSEGAASLYKVLMNLGAGADIALRYEQIQALKNLGDSSNSKLVIVPANMAAVSDVRDIPLIEQVIPQT